jgi:hypothetical protein
MAEETRVWLVERSYGRGEDIVTLVYATPDGSCVQKKQLSHRLLQGTEITAARDVPVDRLEAVDDGDDRERYAEEVARMRDRHDPGEVV